MPAFPEPDLLRVEHLSKHFQPRPRWLGRFVPGAAPRAAAPVKAVDDVSFTVQPGEILGLLGQSGSGKTTLARTILRLTEPTSGKAWLHGRAIFSMTPDDLKTTVRRQVRMIFQHPDAVLNPAFTVHLVIDQALRLHTDLAPAERRERIPDLLHRVRLPASYAEKYPHELSGGEKRRVGICRTLATDPDLIFADEPVSGLDVSLQGQVLDLLLKIRDEHHVAMVFISHDVGLVRRISDRIGVMYEGRLVELGTRDEVSPEACTHPYTRQLFASHISLT